MCPHVEVFTCEQHLTSPSVQHDRIKNKSEMKRQTGGDGGRKQIHNEERDGKGMMR